ncbi:hypothetical protein L1887_34466 [Cichorium endivia]|nr:hypothetical protein L1887_34466 [Cichorium endivia]
MFSLYEDRNELSSLSLEMETSWEWESEMRKSVEMDFASAMMGPVQNETPSISFFHLEGALTANQLIQRIEGTLKVKN